MLSRARFRHFAVAAFVCSLFVAADAFADRSHRVRPGQTLGAIARRYHVHVDDIMGCNGLRRASQLRAGQRLVIPDRTIACVKHGDSLGRIARRHRVGVRALARANGIRTSARLRPGQRLRMPGSAPEYRRRDWGAPREPGLVKLSRGSHRAEIRFFDEEGRVKQSALDALAALMRREDHEGDAERVPDPRLAASLTAMSDTFGGRRIRIVSGFRDPGGHTTESSRHVANQATDIQVVGVPRRNVWERCRRLRNVGCGYYPNSTFTHVDVRRRRTQWVDWSGPGRRPEYGTLEGVRPRGRRAMRFPPSEGAIAFELEIVDDREGSTGNVTRFDALADPEEAEAPDDEATAEGDAEASDGDAPDEDDAETVAGPSGSGGETP